MDLSLLVENGTNCDAVALHFSHSPTTAVVVVAVVRKVLERIIVWTYLYWRSMELTVTSYNSVAFFSLFYYLCSFSFVLFVTYWREW